MIDAFTDELLTMTEAAKACPEVGGKLPSTVTMWRWATKGRRGVKLEHVWIGRHMLTTETALNAFFNGIANAPTVVREPPPQRATQQSEKQREQSIANVKRNLAALGVLPVETDHWKTDN